MKKNYHKIVIIFLHFNLNMCFGLIVTILFEYPQHMLWLRNKKNSFPLHLPVSADLMDITFFVLIKESIKRKEKVTPIYKPDHRIVCCSLNPNLHFASSMNPDQSASVEAD